MPEFVSEGIRISYRIDHPQGATPGADKTPVLMIHGFSSTADVNWFHTGWIKAVLASGRSAVALDNRGHGASQKIHDPAAYPADLMARDALHLLDHLEIARAHVIGYSMGAQITTFLAAAAPNRLASAVIAGMGINLLRGTGDPSVVVEALRAPSLREVASPRGRMFRKFADSIGADLPSLAACMAAPGPKITNELLSDLDLPVLVAVGTEDEVAGSGAELSALIARAELLDIPGRDHMKAVGDKTFIAGTLAFWDSLDNAA